MKIVFKKDIKSEQKIGNIGKCDYRGDYRGKLNYIQHTLRRVKIS